MAKALVRYVGMSDFRTLEAEQVKRDHGIMLNSDMVWRRNQALVVDMGPEFEQLLRDQGHFQISEYTDEGREGETISVATDPERVAETVVDKRDSDTRSKDASSEKK